MPVKMRLARHGKKGSPFYHIVVADARAPRDGRYIERLGSYNPNTNPATIDLDFERALHWMQTGAQPTETVRAMLSYEGVLMMKHLLGGVKKGAFTEEEAKAKFEAWKADKAGKIQAKVDRLANETAEETKKRLAAEAEVNQKRAEEIAKRIADAEAAEKAEEAAESDEAAADDAGEEKTEA